MRLSELHVGDKLIHGRRAELARGKGGVEVFVVGIGNYTRTFAPCGDVIKEFKPRKYVAKRVVVAIEDKRYNYDSQSYDISWVPKLVGLDVIMDPAEYKVKADAVLKQQRATERYHKAREKAEAEAAKNLAALTGLDPKMIRFSRPWNKKTYKSEGNYQPELHCDIETFAAWAKSGISASSLEQAMAPLREWQAQPDPDVCQR